MSNFKGTIRRALRDGCAFGVLVATTFVACSTDDTGAAMPTAHGDGGDSGASDGDAGDGSVAGSGGAAAGAGAAGARFASGGQADGGTDASTGGARSPHAGMGGDISPTEAGAGGAGGHSEGGAGGSLCVPLGPWPVGTFAVTETSRHWRCDRQTLDCVEESSVAVPGTMVISAYETEPPTPPATPADGLSFHGVLGANGGYGEEFGDLTVIGRTGNTLRLNDYSCPGSVENMLPGEIDVHVDMSTGAIDIALHCYAEFLTYVDDYDVTATGQLVCP